MLENLIHKGDIPVTIGIFITPGHRSEVYPDDLGTANPNNRAQEYDAMSDAYTRFARRRDAAGGRQVVHA